MKKSDFWFVFYFVYLWLMTLIPTIIEKTKAWERAYDIYSRLLEDRIIFVGEAVHSAMVNTVIAQMLYLEKKDPDKDIIMYINSPGGEVYSGLAIYDAMQVLKCDVQTICTGLAASMGSVFLTGWTKGKRFALPNSRIMIHQPLISWGGISGQATDIQIEAEEMLKVKKNLTEIIAKHCGKSYETCLADMERNKRMSPQEALEYGLIDKIIWA